MRKLALGLIAIFLAYLGTALWGAWRLRQAVLTRDLAALEARVDWPALRANLKPRISKLVGDEAEKYGRTGQILRKALEGTVASKAVDVLVTPAWLARALRGREFVISRTEPSPRPAGPPPPPESDAEEADPMPPRRLRWAFFESPTRFRIEAVHPRLPDSRMVSILGLQGLSWKLVDVDVIRH